MDTTSSHSSPAQKPAQPAAQTALVIGATGAVGGAVVNALLAAPWCTRVTTIGRRSATTWDAAAGRAKLVQRVIAMEGDGAAIEQAAREPHDLTFCALGVGRPSKVPLEQFIQVDHTWALAFARGARDGGAGHLALLSAIGSDATSRVKYWRIKGEVEDAMKALVFRRLAIFQPSILITPENRFGAVDVFNRKVFPLMSWALPRRLHQVSVADLGLAMVRHSQSEHRHSVEVLSYNDFRPYFAAASPAASQS